MMKPIHSLILLVQLISCAASDDRHAASKEALMRSLFFAGSDGNLEMSMRMDPSTAVPTFFGTVQASIHSSVLSSYNYDYYYYGGKGKGKGKGNDDDDDDDDDDYDDYGKGKGKGGKGKRKGKGKGKGKGKSKRGKGKGKAKGKGKGKGKGGLTYTYYPLETETPSPIPFVPSPPVNRPNPTPVAAPVGGEFALPPEAAPIAPALPPSMPTINIQPPVSSPVQVPSPGLSLGSGGTFPPILNLQPTQAPQAQDTDSSPRTKPTVPKTPPPTPVPAPAPVRPTSNMDGFSFVLAPYSLFYELPDGVEASSADYAGLESITQDFINFVFGGIFDILGEDVYLRATTVLHATRSNVGQPVQVEYRTTVYLSALSELGSSEGELNDVLAFLFGDEDSQVQYLLAIQDDLPRSNAFSKTTRIWFEATRVPQPRSSNTSANSRTVGLVAASGAGILGLMLAAFFIRRGDQEEEDDMVKYYDGDGHLTVAGDTFMGGSSLDAQSAVHRAAPSCDMESVWSDYQESTGPNQVRPRSPTSTLAGVREDIEEDEDADGSQPADMEDLDLL